MIYEFKALYKSKSGEHSMQRTQNVLIIEVTRLSKVNRSHENCRPIHQVYHTDVRGRARGCVHECMCVCV